MRIHRTGIFHAYVLAIAAMGRAGAQDVFKFPGCSDVTKANFTKVALVDKTKNPDLDEPIRFAVAGDGSIYFAERSGGLKVMKPNGTIVKLGRVPSWPTDAPLKKNGSNELGLTGLALDPDFANNHQLYVDYEPVSPDVMNISRFTLNGDALDPASEKILLSFPMQKNYCCHSGGSMQFDSKGDLWISVGNNTRNPANDQGYIDEAVPDGDDQGHAANTNDYRGKILRIHPTPDGKYTVPAGNLKEVYASLWDAAGLAKVKPEIYTMGHRNPYTLSVDSFKGLLMWGDVGPDDGWETEEFNLVAKPGFMGWPYFAGAAGNPHYKYKLDKDPAAPTNLSKNNSGVQNLPPAQGATIGYGQSAAVTGPIYRYSPAQTYAKKLPPHFDGKWFIAEFNQGWIHIATLDASGTRISETKSLMTGLIRPLQVTIGPDGALYTLEYANNFFVTDGATRIARWDYTGSSCTAVSLADQAPASGAEKMNVWAIGLGGRGGFVLPAGARTARLIDLQGRVAWEIHLPAQAPRRQAVPASVAPGLYRIRFGN